MAEARLPTVEEIAALPRWARVAFAARCARLALPYLQQHWRTASDKYRTAVEKAVSVAEHAATAAAMTDTYAAAFAYAAANVANSTANAFAATNASADAAYYAAYAAAAAADPPANASAAAAAARAGVPVPLIANSFRHLLAAARAGQWDDSTPVPPSVFDSLGPIALPKVTDAKGDNTFTLDIEIPDHIPDEDAVNWVRRLAGRLNDLHVTGGGHGLAVVPPIEITAEIESLVPAGGPTP